MEAIPNLEALSEDIYINFGSSLVVDSSVWPDSKDYQSSSIVPPEDDSSDYIDDEEDFNGNFHGDDEKYPPQPPQSHQKHQCICSSVYSYYKDMIPGGEWDEEKQALQYKYKCCHCSNKSQILGKNTSNLNKHRTRCVDCFTAWETKCPGLIDPNLGAKMEAEGSDTLMKDLLAIQVSFSIFETDQLQSILQQIFLGFPWPKRCQIASLASQLYYESKQAIIDEVYSLPPETKINTAIDFWTTKDQIYEHKADCSFTHSQTMGGSHSGVQLEWKFWEPLSECGMLDQLYSITGDNVANNTSIMGSLKHKFNRIILKWPKDEQFNRPACQVLNLVAKDFLAQMGQLTNEDYFFFNNYLAVHCAPIEDSEDEESSTMTELNETITKVQKNSGIRPPKRQVQPSNQRNLETQDNLGDLQLINDNVPNNHGSHRENFEPGPLSPGKIVNCFCVRFSWWLRICHVVWAYIKANKSIFRALRDLCSHIQGSPKQLQEFIQAFNNTRDPKLLPINIPMTRWNYFLRQIKRAE
ncbi:hypothetical protein O181_086591 [Austropuccinia psidii MF-1]|uniref:BED-type domain-containing protein n=1 Tax=Austropuccinia psidii MF-1 TaxID=1389203 RepID=A0A9Q3G073_9BASI|nr:hypothetical protein [Austropuccinia psidii MF-1]